MQRERGSISVFLSVLLVPLLVVALIVSEYAYIRFSFQKARADQYVELDAALAQFHRPLFQEMGLLGVETELTEGYFQPLSEPEVMLASIQALMDQRILLDLTMGAERLVNEFIGHFIELDFELFDIQALNQELHQLLNWDVEDPELPARLERFVVKLVTMKPYVELEGISLERLKDLLLELEFEAIRELRPYFVIKPELRAHYESVMATVRKYDLLGALDRYELADYAVDYLGYSLTQEEKSTLHCEYLLTAIKDKALQRPVIVAELYGLRLTLNLIEVSLNPILRQRVLVRTGGIPKLFMLEALRMAAFEAGLDVKYLLERRPVPLYKGQAGWISDSAGLKQYEKGWTYPDYLKLMLMLLPQSLYYKRLQMAIEHNYELDLAQLYTAVKSEREIRIQSKVMRREFHRQLEGALYFVRTRID